jgi:hypothetical protein
MEIFAREAKSSMDLTIAMLNSSTRIDVETLTLSVENNDHRPAR